MGNRNDLMYFWSDDEDESSLSLFIHLLRKEIRSKSTVSIASPTFLQCSTESVGNGFELLVYASADRTLSYANAIYPTHSGRMDVEC